MHGILSYEERVRLERANGIRPQNDCAPCGSKCSGTDEFMKGMTYDDLGDTLQPLRRVCPHTKVIVPVTPALMVDEPVKRITPIMGSTNWRVADLNKCDARNQGLYAIPNDSTVDLAQTTATVGKRVVDNPFDYPHQVTTVTLDIEAKGDAVQPVSTGAKTAEPEKGTEDGQTLVEFEDLGQEED